jgi:hypothetical protein
MDDVTRRRLKHNEELFRKVNEERNRSSGGGELELVCECADRACTARIRVDEEDYRQVRAVPDRFVVAPGHTVPGLEDVVDAGPGYEVVSKV